MKVIDIHEYKKGNIGVKVEPITIEDVKEMSNSDLPEYLQECIDLLAIQKLYSNEWNGIRDWIDEVVDIVQQRLK